MKYSCKFHYIACLYFYVIAINSCLVIQCHAGESDDVPKIEVMLFEGGEGLKFFLECAREFEKEAGNVKVDLYGDPRIADKMRVRILEKTHPEITNAPLDIWKLAEANLIMPLDEFLDRPNWEGTSSWRDSFVPGSLDLFSLDGKTYGIPLSYHILAIWYNKGMFEENGWTTPRTWTEFFRLCEEIKAKGIAPFAFQGRYPGYAQLFINSAYFHIAGKDAFDKQNRLEKSSYDNPEFIKALELVQETGFEFFQEGSMGMSHTEAQLQFFNGNTAMVLCGSWLKNEMTGKIPDDFKLGTFNFPVPDDFGQESPTLAISGGYLHVLKKSRNPELAVDFLRFMTSKKMAARFCELTDIPVAVRGVSELHLSADLEDLSQMIAEAKSTFSTGIYQKEMEQAWSDACFNLLTPGRMSPKKVALELERQARIIRDRHANPDRVTIRHIWKPVILLTLLGSAPVYCLIMRLIGRRAKKRSVSSDYSFGRTKLSWRAIILFILPAVIIYTVFVIVPCVKSFVWSLFDWNGISAMRFTGFLNFKRLLFEDDSFWIALRNNLFLMLVIPLFVLPISLFLSACISCRAKGSKIFRAVVLFPNIMGVVATTLLWMHIFNPQGGVANRALFGIGKFFSNIGLDSIGAWLEGFRSFAWLSPDHLYWAIVPIAIWDFCGFNIILLLAAMETVPKSLYEASEIDGASQWRRFWSITFPLIHNVLTIAVVFMVIAGIKAFERIWLLTNQSPATQTHVIGTRMLQSMYIESRVGEATAIAVLLFIMVLYGSVLTIRFLRREKVEF